MHPLRWITLALLSLSSCAFAQIQVDIHMPLNLYILGEIIPITVTVTNLSGGDIDLTDQGYKKWFGFNIQMADGRPIPPRDADYINPPVQLGAGQKIVRKVNITPLYPVDEFGAYRIQAEIFLASSNRHFQSPSLNFDVTEGLKFWQKSVGVPEGTIGAGENRVITLLIHQLPESRQLYLRIEDPQSGIRKCMHKLGRLVVANQPEIQLDDKNRVHVLQNCAPRMFLYSIVGLEGEVIKRASYEDSGSHPVLRRSADGSVVVAGGKFIDPNAKKTEQAIPSLSDRTVPLPGLPIRPGTQQEKRPDSLLSH